LLELGSEPFLYLYLYLSMRLEVWCIVVSLVIHHSK